LKFFRWYGVKSRALFQREYVCRTLVT